MNQARTRVKICGVRTAEAALAAAEAGADAVGLVFVERSPRCVTLDEARQVVKALPAMVEPIALFVDETVARVREVANAVGLRTVQLHGREGPGYVQRLPHLRVIKALSFDSGDASDRLAPWRGGRPRLAGILWDAPPTHREALGGGSGQTFDWSALAALAQRGELAGLPPMLLAGGLTPGNVAEAVATLRPFAVDVSSGVESAPGVKDPEKIAAFCRAVREADARAAARPAV